MYQTYVHATFYYSSGLTRNLTCNGSNYIAESAFLLSIGSIANSDFDKTFTVQYKLNTKLKQL